MNYPIRPDLKNIEPYFSSEPLAEIGFSMEQNVSQCLSVWRVIAQREYRFSAGLLVHSSADQK